MKKFLVMLFCLSTVMCFAGCNRIGEINNRSDSSDTAVVENQDNASAPDDNSGNSTEQTMANSENEEYSIELLNAYSMYAGGRDYILIEAEFTNNSNDNKSFYDVYNMRAYQNGVEIAQNNSWNCSNKNFDLKMCASKVQPGYSTNIYMGFEAKNKNDSVSVECLPSSSNANEAKKLMSINSSNYKIPTQATTTAPKTIIIEKEVPVPQQNYNYSSGAGYTCYGLSMQSAVNLMSQSEKSIISNSSNQTLINEQYAKHGYCFNDPDWHRYFYGYDH